MKETKPKQKRKNRTKMISGSEFVIQIFSLLSIAVLIIQRFMILNRCDIQGGGYFFSVYNFIILLGLLLPFTLPDVIEEYVRELVRKEQYNNAKRVMYAGFFLGSVYCLILVCVVISGYFTFRNQFLLGNSEFLILLFLLIAVTLYTYTGVFLGFLNGLDKQFLKAENELFRNIIQLIGILGLTGVLLNYGNKVSVVLSNDSLRFSFTASGAALAYLISAVVSLISAIFLFRKYSRKFHKLQRMDDTRKNLDVYDCFRLIAAKVFPYGGGLLLFEAPLFIGQWMFFEMSDTAGKGKITELASYQWGSYSGLFYTFLVLIFLLGFQMVFFYKDSFLKYLKQKNMQEVRRINHSIKLFSIITGLIVMALMFIMAPELAMAATGYTSMFGTALLRFGAPFAFLYAYAVSELVVYLMAELYKTLLVNGLISIAVNIFLNLLLLRNTNLGIYSILISAYVTIIVFICLSVLYFNQNFRLRDKYVILLKKPFFAVAGMALVTLILHLVFGLFMPAGLSIAVNLLVSLLAVLVGLVKLRCIDELMLSKSPFGLVICRVCGLLHLF